MKGNVLKTANGCIPAFCGLFCVYRNGSRLFLALPQGKDKESSMSKRTIKIRSGREEVSMEVTEEEYRKYYRPWWQEKERPYSSSA